MQFEGHGKTSSVPNLTPLIDIVFLLLIFFMLTSQFVRHEVMNVALPESDTSVSSDLKNDLEVVISSEGQFFWHKEVISPQQLEVVLKTEISKSDKRLLNIRGDQAAQLEQIVKLMDIARRSGIEGVNIITLKK